MGTNRPDGGYSADTKAWLEIAWHKVPLSRTNDRQLSTITPRWFEFGTKATLVTSIDGIEHRRRIRITGGVAWEYEEIE